MKPSPLNSLTANGLGREVKSEGKKRKIGGRARTRGKVCGGRRANALFVRRGVEVCRPLRVRGNMEVRGKPPWVRTATVGFCGVGSWWPRDTRKGRARKRACGACGGLPPAQGELRYVDKKTAPLREGEAPSVVWNQPRD